MATINANTAALTVTTYQASLDLDPYAASVLTDSPVGYWRLQDTAEARDYVGTNHGTLGSGISLGDGPFHGVKAYKFDGTSDATSRVDLGFNTNYTSFTVEFWLRIDSAITHSAEIISKRSYFATAHADFPVAVYVGSAGNLTATFSDNTDYSTETALNAAALAKDEWHHVAVSWQNSNYARLYINGYLEDSDEDVTYALSTNSRNWCVGAPAFGNGAGENTIYSEDVAVAEVALYNFNLTPARMRAHVENYTASKPSLTITTQQATINDPYGSIVQEDSPVGYWPITDVSDFQFGSRLNAAVDEAGRHTLTLRSTSTFSTTQSKFGGTSLYCPNASTGLDVTGNLADFAFGTGPWTIEFWIYPTSTNTNQHLVDFRKNDPGTEDGVIWLNGRNPSYYDGATVSSTAGALSLNTWHHIVVQYTGTNLQYIVNGSAAGNTAHTINVVEPPRIRLGANTFNGSEGFIGYMDDIRITKGTARYSYASLTVPASSYFDSPPLDLTSLLDKSGSNHLVYSGTPTYDPALITYRDKAVAFNGTDEYLKRTVANFQNTDTQGSVEAWIKTTDTGEGIVWAISDEASTTWYAYLAINNGEVKWRIQNTSVNYVYETSGESVNDGEWHHVVVAIGPTNTRRIYIDGVNTGTTGNGFWLNGNMSNTDNLTIGALDYSGGAVSHFDGTIDEVVYYDAELTADQVLEHYMAGGEVASVPLTITTQPVASIEQQTHYEKIIEDSSPISWWKLDEYTWDGTDTFDELDPDVWDKYSSGSITSDTYAVSNGALNLGLIASGTSGVVGASNRFLLSGDFDIVVEADNFSHDAGTSAIYYHVQTTLLGGAGYYNVGVVQATNVATQEFRKDVNGTQTSYSKTDDTPFRVRMARVGTTLTFYTDDNVGSWTSRGSHTVSANDGTLSLLAYAFGNTTEVSVDTLSITATADTINQRAYRDYGSEDLHLNANDSLARVPAVHEPKIANDAVDLDGTDQTIVRTTTDYRSTDNIGTVEAWVEPDVSGDKAIFSVCTSNAGERLVIYASSTRIFVATYDNTLGDDNVYANHDVGANRFHVVVTTTGSAWKVYVNGIERTVTVNSGTNGGYWLADLVSNNTDRVFIGAWMGNNVIQSYFDGTIDEVIYYNRQLSEGEIFEHYQAGANPYRTFRGQVEYDRAVNHWPMGKQSIGGSNVSLYLRGRENVTDQSSNTTAFSTTATYAAGGKFIDPNRGDNQAIDFNGSGHIYTNSTYGSGSIWDMQGDFTIQAWVKLDSYQAWRTICAWFDNGGEGWRLLVGADGVLHFSTDDGTTNGFYGQAGDVPTGEWVHIAATNKDGVNKGWVNGKLVATKTSWSFTPPSTARQFRIGSTDGTNWKWDGQMQEIMIHDGIALWDNDFDVPHGTHFTYEDFGSAPLDLGVGNGASIVDSLIADGQRDYGDIPHIWARASEFNGTNEYLFSNYPNFRSTDNVGSVEAWFVKDGTSTDTLFALSSDSNNAEYFLIYLLGSNEVNVRIATSNAFVIHASATQTGLNDGKPHHVVVTSDGSTLKIYIDGDSKTLTLNESTTNSGQWINDIGSATDNVTIGVLNKIALSNYMDGKVDDVAYYDYALSAGQVSDHYELGVAQNKDALTITTQAASVLTGGSGGTINANTDALILTEQQANIDHAAISVDTNVDALILTEQPASIGFDTEFTATTQALVLTELQASVAESYAAAVLADSPIAYLRLEETSGTVHSDSSGNGNAGYATAAFDLNRASLLYNSPNDNAVRTNSNTESIELTNGLIDSFPFTVEMWGQFNSISGTLWHTSPVAGKYSGVSVSFVNGKFYMRFGRNVATGTNDRRDFQTNGYLPVANEIHHYVFVVPSHGNASVFVDGTEYSFDYVSGTGSTTGFDNSKPFTIGYNAEFGNVAWGLVYDELAIYDTALTQTDAEDHYHAGAGLPYGTIASGKDTLIITGQTATIELPQIIVNGTTDALIITEQQATIDDGQIPFFANAGSLTLTTYAADVDKGTLIIEAVQDALIITERQASINFDEYEIATNAPVALSIYEFSAGINEESTYLNVKKDTLLITTYVAGIDLPVIGIASIPDVLRIAVQRADIQWDAIYVEQLAPVALTHTTYAATISTGINANAGPALSITTFGAGIDLDANEIPINVATAALTTTTYQAFVEKDTLVTTNLVELEFKSGGDVTLGWDIALETNTASIILTALTLDFPVDVDANNPALTITEQGAEVLMNTDINTTPSQVQFTTYAADVLNETLISGATDALVITTNNQTVLLSPTLNVNCNEDPLIITEQQAEIVFDVAVACSLFPMVLTDHAVSFGFNVGLPQALTLTTYVADPDMTIDITQGANVALTLTTYQSDVNLDVNISATKQHIVVGPFSATISLPVTVVDANAGSLTVGAFSATIQVVDTVFDTTEQNLVITTHPAEVYNFIHVNASTVNMIIYEKDADAGAPTIIVNGTAPPAFTITTYAATVTNVVTHLIRTNATAFVDIETFRADPQQPIEKVYTANVTLTATEYPASIDMPIINTVSNPDVITFVGQPSAIEYVSTLVIEPTSFVQQNFNIGFDWSDDPATKIVIDGTSIPINFVPVTFRYEIPDGVIGYKIVMAGSTEYELIK